MLQWFVVKITYQKGNEDGKIQKMTEEYLFDALTYGEVEQRVHEELAENMRFEFNLANIAKTNLHEIFYFEIDESAMQAHWFKCKVNFLELDEEKGKEKKVQQYMLVFASSLDDAYQKLQQALSESGLRIFEITAIQQTKITDVFGRHMDKKEIEKEEKSTVLEAIEQEGFRRSILAKIEENTGEFFE